MVQMILLGIVQGLTEFLPVSSSAHLVFAEHFLGVPRPGLVLEAILHLGTALAAILLFWPDVRRLLTGSVAWLRIVRSAPRPAADPYSRLAWLILLATAVTGVIGVAFLERFEQMFESIRGTALQLMATGVILLLARERGRRGMLETRLPDAALIGLAQGIAIVPGISRSGITVAAALWAGLAREEAARLSFLVAIPALIAAGLFALKDLSLAAALGYTPADLLVGFAVSASSGAIAIRWLLDAIRRGRLALFALYCWVVGGAVLLSTFR
jgi:undecaprenyl-diphosphatase